MIPVLVVLLNLSIPSAKAFDSPVEGLKDLLSKTKTIIIIPDRPSKQKKDKQNNPPEKKHPKKVDDPSETEKAADFASSATGVRKDFLMGMLVVESDLGRNPGKCTYKEVEDSAAKDFDQGNLSQKAWDNFKERSEIFKKIADSLDYDYEGLSVSCEPPYYGTGGAMGIPQFMPDTWMEYKDRIAEITGKDNPDPWDIVDGAVAMALKLSDVPGVADHSLLAERNAAKYYLSGSVSWRFDWYANQIEYWAMNYKSLFG